MSTLVIVLLVAGVTVGSRVVALVVLPAPRGVVAATVRRLPAPLFAALGALSVVTSRAGPNDPALLLALACALVSTRWSSLLVTLGAGIIGFVVGSAVW